MQRIKVKIKDKELGGTIEMDYEISIMEEGGRKQLDKITGIAFLLLKNMLDDGVIDQDELQFFIKILMKDENLRQEFYTKFTNDYEILEYESSEVPSVITDLEDISLEYNKTKNDI